MKVNLIYFTGMGFSDPLWAAKLLAYTKNTRLEQGAETRQKIFAMPEEELLAELDYISKTIRSSWEFVDFIFEISEVTRAFTHQLVRTRTASFAQQSQRSVDMTGFQTTVPLPILEIDNGEAWYNLMDHVSEVYGEYHERGVSAQDCRGVLPTNIHTNIIAKMNLRTFADIVGKRENLRAQGEYADVVRKMKEDALKAMPWIDPFINPKRTATPALDELMALALGDASPVDKPKINAALKEIDALKATWG